ncbi:MAG: cell division protein FtsL [Pseudomonadota bacterium]
MSKRGLVIAFLLVWFSTLATALSIVKVRHEARAHFMELQRLEARIDELDMEWDRLLIEESTWSNHSQIEQTARQRLAMRLPAPSEVKVVRR